MRSLILVLFLFLTSCHPGALCKSGKESFLCSGGTSTGNPLETQPAQEIPNNGIESPFLSDRMAVRLCSKMVMCYSELTMNSCYDGFLLSSSVDSEIGVPAGRYASYAGIINGERTGELVGDESVAPGCFEDINSLTCNYVGSNGAFIDGAAEAFAGVARILPPSCQGLMKER